MTNEAQLPVLVIGDRNDGRAAVSATLRLAGYDAVEVDNGRLALDILLDESRREPCAIVLDAEMATAKDGDFLAIVKSFHRLSTIPVIILSAEDAPATVPPGPVAEYLRKPHNPAQLTAIVGAFARHHT